MVPMHDGFMKMFKTIKQFHNHPKPATESAFKNWFRDILIDSCIENARTNACELQNNLTDFDFPYIHNTETGSLSSKTIIDGIRMLSFYCRTVFNLKVIDKYSHDDISSKLEISVPEVEYNLKRAREELRKKFHRLSMDKSMEVSNFPNV
jgi:RNA polymerase sigma factor (sigma-70 family)